MQGSVSIEITKFSHDMHSIL